MQISGLSSQITHNIFNKLDSNHQGYLDESQLSEALGDEDNAEALMAMIDEDDNGQLSKSELTKGVENLLGALMDSMHHPQMHGAMPSPPPPKPRQGETNLSEGVTLEQAIDIAEASEDEHLSMIMEDISDNFDEIDLDEDGIVTPEEGMAFHDAMMEEEIAALDNIAKLVQAYGLAEAESESSALSVSV